jgi:membrane protease YdiL (CAAX protease family)
MINIIYPVVLYLVITFGIVFAIRELDLRIEAGNVILVLILQQTASLVVIYWIYRLQNRTGALGQKFHFSDLGIKNLVLIIAATYFVLSSISLLSVVLRLNESFTGYSEIYKIITAGPIPLQFISAVILAPALEEVLCRGIIYNRMREISNFFVSALVSSLIWSAAHMNVVQGFTAFLYGIFLAFLYEKFKTLWVTIGSHSLFNLIAVASGYLAALSEKSIEADLEMMGPADAAVPLIINLLIAVWLIHLLHPSKLPR